MRHLFTNKVCVPNDLTIRYLEKRLKQLDKKTKKPHARTKDFINRERIVRQLADAKTYLC